jgi:uncharacterized protein (TIGR02444 family)
MKIECIGAFRREDGRMADDDLGIRGKHSSSTHEHPYWRFSIAFYARPGIQELLLKAQEDALDINMMLYALWQAGERHSVSSGDFVKLNEAIADWRRTILLPIRALRHSLKSRDKGGELYAQAKALELSSEKVQQQIMYTQAIHHLKSGISSDAIDQLALNNLASYVEAMDLSLPKPVAEKLASELRSFVET